MEPRLDPACPEARDLEAQHRQQERLLVVDRESQLAKVVRGTQEGQLRAHKRACARCDSYAPSCPGCGFDPREGRHGWMCKHQETRWKDVLPWNWRPRFARVDAASPPSATARADPTRRVPLDEPPRPAPASASTPPTPLPGGGSVASRPASSAPKPRPKPAAPRSDALQLAYQTLGVSPAASDDDVRGAYRAKAQQYQPDKVATMAPEFRDLADRKMKEINQAYERVKRAR